MIVLKILGWVLLGVLGLIAAVLLVAVVAMCIRVHLNIEYSSENTSVTLKYLFIKLKLYPRSKKSSENTFEQPDDTQETVDARDDGTAEREAAENSVPEPEKYVASNTVVKKEIKENFDKEQNIESVEILTESEAVTDVEDLNSAPGTEEEPVQKKAGKKVSIKELLSTFYNAEGIDGLILLLRRICDYFGTFIGSLFRDVVIDRLDLDVRCTKSDAASTAIYYGEVCSALFPMLGSLAAKCRLKEKNINVYPDYIARFSSASFAADIHFTPLVILLHLLALGIKMLFKVILQIIVKIFLYIKNGKNTGNENKKSEEKSEVTNE